MHYINISVGLESNCHLFVDVVRTDNETKAHLFLCCPLYWPSYAALGGNFFSDVVGIASNEQSLRFSDSQKVDILLFGSSRLSNEENVEIFCHVQQLLRSVQTLSFNLNVKSIF